MTLLEVSLVLVVMRIESKDVNYDGKYDIERVYRTCILVVMGDTRVIFIFFFVCDHQ